LIQIFPLNPILTLTLNRTRTLTRTLIQLVPLIIHHIQAERGVAISAEAWKLAVSHAEGQVILVEKKVERQRHAHDIRYAKLIFSSLLFFILNQIKSENDSLQHKEREAHVSMQRNNSLMKKVTPQTLASTPFISLFLNLVLIRFYCVL
jgi:hypothetical protein